MSLDKYTNDIPGMSSTQFMTVEEQNGTVHQVILNGEFTEFGNKLFGFHEIWPIDKRAPKNK